MREGDRSRILNVVLLVTPTVCALSTTLPAQLTALGDPAPAPAWRLALVIACALSLLLRRRWPVPVLLFATVSFALTIDVPPLAFAVYAVMAAPRLPVWSRLLPATLLLIIPLGYLGHMLLFPREWGSLTLVVLNMVVVIVICVVLPAAVGLLVRARREQAAVITQLTESRHREAQLIAAVTRVQERNLLAREMHDVVADKISLISVRAGALAAISASDKLEPDQVQAEANTIRSLSRTTLTELRNVITVLRDPTDPAEECLTAIPKLVTDSGLDATLIASEATLEKRWEPMIHQTVYRTVQEALTNVRKYAPSASVLVELAETEEGLEITIRNGPPTSSAPPGELPSGGHGLIGLRERANLLGAKLHATPTADGGFQVTLRIPTQSHQPHPLMPSAGPEV